MYAPLIYIIYVYCNREHFLYDKPLIYDIVNWYTLQITAKINSYHSNIFKDFDLYKSHKEQYSKLWNLDFEEGDYEDIFICDITKKDTLNSYLTFFKFYKNFNAEWYKILFQIHKMYQGGLDKSLLNYFNLSNLNDNQKQAVNLFMQHDKLEDCLNNINEDTLMYLACLYGLYYEIDIEIINWFKHTNEYFIVTTLIDFYDLNLFINSTFFTTKLQSIPTNQYRDKLYKKYLSQKFISELS